jgi:hypothetical protein
MHYGKVHTFSLRTGLRIFFLILGGVRHRKIGSVSHLDGHAQPFPFPRNGGLRMLRDTPSKPPDDAFANSRPSTTIITGIGRDLTSQNRIVNSNAKHGCSTGPLHSSEQCLGDHGPHCHRHRIDGVIASFAERNALSFKGLFDIVCRQSVATGQPIGLQERPTNNLKWARRNRVRCAKRHETFPGPVSQTAPKEGLTKAKDKPSRPHQQAQSQFQLGNHVDPHAIQNTHYCVIAIGTRQPRNKSLCVDVPCFYPFNVIATGNIAV